MKQKDIVVVVLLIGLIIVARILPHLPNFAPVAAAALLAGAYLGRKWALIVPISGMFLSDLIIGFYHPLVMLSVYGSFLLIGLIAWHLKSHRQPLMIISTSLFASVLFYLITNLVVWLASDWYANNLSGLLLSYQLALPFFRYTILGDLVYTAVLFGAYELSVFVLVKRQLAWQSR